MPSYVQQEIAPVSKLGRECSDYIKVISGFYLQHGLKGGHGGRKEASVAAVGGKATDEES